MKKLKLVDRSQEAQDFVDHFSYVYCKKDNQVYYFNQSDGIYHPADTVEIKHQIDQYLLAGYSDFEWDSGTFKFFLEHITTKAKVVEEMGAKPGIIVFKNGTLHLKDMSLHPHSKDNMAITALPCNYDPTARSNLVKKYATDVSNGSLNMEKSIQEFLGAVLVHSVRPHRALIAVGAGANGKSCLLFLAEILCGREVAAKISLSDLVSKKSFDRLSILNANLVVIHELEQGLKLEHLLSENPKRLITSEHIDAEEKFGKKLYFKPRMTLMCASNYMPIIEKPSPSLMRRLLIMRFTRSFSEKEQNPNLIRELSKEKELSGVVNYALEGYQRLRQQNYVYSLQEESDAYYLQCAKEFAPYNLFVQENVVPCAGNKLNNDDLSNAYKLWAKNNDIAIEDNLDAMGKHLTTALKDCNIPFDTGHSGSVRYKTGIKLVSKEE